MGDSGIVFMCEQSSLHLDSISRTKVAVAQITH